MGANSSFDHLTNRIKRRRITVPRIHDTTILYEGLTLFLNMIVGGPLWMLCRYQGAPLLPHTISHMGVAEALSIQLTNNPSPLTCLHANEPMREVTSQG